MLISRSDFTGRINVSPNIPDAEINISINNAEYYVFKPMVDPLMYAALAALTGASPASELKTFWTDYVKPFLVFAFAKDFMVLHGRNITQFGVSEIFDDTSNPVKDGARAEVIAVFERNYNIELSRLKTKLSDVAYTFDSVVYLEGDIISNIKPRSILRGIG